MYYSTEYIDWSFFALPFFLSFFLSLCFCSSWVSFSSFQPMQKKKTEKKRKKKKKAECSMDCYLEMGRDLKVKFLFCSHKGFASNCICTKSPSLGSTVAGGRFGTLFFSFLFFYIHFVFVFFIFILFFFSFYMCVLHCFNLLWSQPHYVVSEWVCKITLTKCINLDLQPRTYIDNNTQHEYVMGRFDWIEVSYTFSLLIFILNFGSLSVCHHSLTHILSRALAILSMSQETKRREEKVKKINLEE